MPRDHLRYLNKPELDEYRRLCAHWALAMENGNPDDPTHIQYLINLMTYEGQIIENIHGENMADPDDVVQIDMRTGSVYIET